MRHLLAVCLLLTAAATAIALQASSQAKTIATLRQFDSPNASDAGVAVQQTAFYMDGPSAGVPARPAVPGAAVSVSSFSLRAWKEGDKARLVVYAVMNDPRAPNGRTETPIATFALGAGESADVREAERWGAARLTVSVINQ
jgi:hypothetical protein